MRSLTPGFAISSLLLLMAFALLLLLVTQQETSGISLGPRYLRTLAWTTLQATLSTTLSIAVGVLLAWALSHQRHFWGRDLFVALLSSALVLPTLVVVLGLITVLGRSGWINDFLLALHLKAFDPFIYGLPGILIAHTYFNASFAARTTLNRLSSIPSDQRKLATSIGLTPWQRFRLLELPAMTPALPPLCTTIFLLCFTSFAIVLVLGGSPKYNTLEVSIYEAVKLDFDLGRAAGLSLLQLGVCALLVLASSRAGNALSIDVPDNAPQFISCNKPERVFQICIITGFGIFFLAPLIAIASDGLQSNLLALVLEPIFIRALLTSLAIATASTVIVVIASIFICITITTLATRMRRTAYSSFLLKFINFSATLYLVIPSLVLGLGFFLLARKTGGNYFTWSIVALLAANTLLVMPFALTSLSPAMIKAANRYDRLASSLAITGISRWRLIESPLLRPELAYIASLAFCMSLGDLGVIALFGTQDFVTLPWLLYQKMGSYRSDDAAGIALITLSITLLVFLTLPRIRASRSEPSAC